MKSMCRFFLMEQESGRKGMTHRCFQNIKRTMFEIQTMLKNNDNHFSVWDKVTKFGHLEDPMYIC